VERPVEPDGAVDPDPEAARILCNTAVLPDDGAGARALGCVDAFETPLIRSNACWFGEVVDLKAPATLPAPASRHSASCCVMTC